MSEIKLLADKLRQLSSAPITADNMIGNERTSEKKGKSNAPEPPKTLEPFLESNPDGGSDKGVEDFLKLIREFDNISGTKQLHVRIDDRSFFMLNQLKVSTGIGMRQFIAFAVNYVFQNHGELKSVIKKSLQNLEL